MDGASPRSRRALPAWLAVAMLVALAGCASAPADGLEEETHPLGLPVVDGVVQPFTLPFSLSNCKEGGLILLIGFDQARRHLPDGFEPADAQTMFGTPVPLGKAGVFMTSTTCDGSNLSAMGYSEALLAITATPPHVHTEHESTVDLYVVAAATMVPKLSELLKALDYTIMGDSIRYSPLFSPATAQGTGSVSGANGTLYAFEVAGARTGLELGGTFRWWHKSHVGLGFIDYDVEARVHLGAATCTLSGIAAEVAGATDCLGHEAVGAVVSVGDVAARLTWLGQPTMGEH